MVVGSGTCERHETLVLFGKFANNLAHFYFRFSFGQMEFAVELEFLGHFCVEFVEALHADHVQHLLYVFGGVGKVFHVEGGIGGLCAQ